MEDAELRSVEEDNLRAEYDRDTGKEYDEEEEWEHFQQTNKDITDKVRKVNELLKKWEPQDISFDSYGGYTGYKPQYQIDAMNAVFGFDGWSFKEISNVTSEILAIANVEVSITGINRTASAYGQGRITKGDVGDSMKSAQTDAIKKALSYFSIGNRAYKGELPKPNGSQKSYSAPQSKEPTKEYGSTRPASEAQIDAIIKMKSKLGEDCDNNQLKMLSVRQASAEFTRLSKLLADAKDNEDIQSYDR